MVLWTLALLAWLAGHWPGAKELADAAYDLTEQTQYQHALIWTARTKALIEADLGLVDEARASAAAGIAFSETISEAHTIFGLGSLGHLELALGNLEAAGGHLRDLPGRLLAGGMNDPTQPRLGGHDRDAGRARRAGARPVATSRHTRRTRSAWGARWRWRELHRCRGLLAAAEGDVAAAIDDFELAVAEQPSPPWPFERARTLLCLGSARRQAKQKRAARESARAGACDLRGARRPAVGREGTRGAAADQRPQAGVRRADRDGGTRRRARRARAARTRRSPPSSTWASAPSERTSRTSTASSASARARSSPDCRQGLQSKRLPGLNPAPFRRTAPPNAHNPPSKSSAFAQFRASRTRA